MRCAVEVEPVRVGPHAGAEQVTQVLLGEPLEVIATLRAWARVVTAYDCPGWVREEALAEGEGELPPPPQGATPLEAARTFLGSPYEWGGMTERGIDCSGLVHIAFRTVNRLVPRDCWQQEAVGVPVAAGEEQPGDLIVYGDDARADHIAFYTGAGRILHATARDQLGVVEEDEPADLRSRRRSIVRL
jgi:gamma-D-glutamyl-L-lysine dipeptidyl-peptidase